MDEFDPLTGKITQKCSGHIKKICSTSERTSLQSVHQAWQHAKELGLHSRRALPVRNLDGMKSMALQGITTQFQRQAQVLTATSISVRHTWNFPRKKVVFCRVLAWWKMAIGIVARGKKRAQLATKLQVDSLKLKQGTSMCVHVNMKACAMYLVKNRILLTSQRRASTFYQVKGKFKCLLVGFS